MKLKSIKITVVMEDETRYSKPKEKHKFELASLGNSGCETVYYPPDPKLKGAGAGKQHLSDGEGIDCLARWIKDVAALGELDK